MQHFINHPSIEIIAEKTDDQSFDFVPVRVTYIKEALDNLNPRKAVGCDNISQRLLRLSSPVISEPLTCLINHFISNRNWQRSNMEK